MNDFRNFAMSSRRLMSTIYENEVFGSTLCDPIEEEIDLNDAFIEENEDDVIDDSFLNNGLNILPHNNDEEDYFSW
jgi:hypothetical protein